MTKRANYFFKRLFRQKTTFSINLIGLSISFFICFCIFLFVNYELGFDQLQSKKDRIYRLVEEDYVIFPGVFLRDFDGKINDAEEICRLTTRTEAFSYEGEPYQVDKTIFADTNFFKIFDHRIIAGSFQDFQIEHSAFISESLAKKIFKGANPINKVLRLSKRVNVLIKGVYEDIPSQSFIAETQMIVNISTLNIINPSALDNYQNSGMNIFILAKPEASPDAILHDFKMTQETKVTPYELSDEISLQSLNDIHLKSYNLSWDMKSRGDFRLIYQFIIIGLLILIVALFNYVNLSTARAGLRAKEVGIKKVLGISTLHLRFQFILEALFISALAMVIALILFELSSDYIQNTFDLELSFQYVSWPLLLFFVFSLILFSGFFAGAYPAYVLSSFKCIDALKAKKTIQKEFFGKKIRFQFRHILVAFQFITSAFLIASTLFMYKQLNYMQTRDLGIKQDFCIMVRNPYHNMNLRYHHIKQELVKSPLIESVTACHNEINRSLNNYGSIGYADGDKNENFHAGIIGIAPDFFQVMETKMIKGISFTAADTEKKRCIINQSLANKLGGEPLGRRLKGLYDDNAYEVIGIVNDIFFNDVHKGVMPAIYAVYENEYPGYARCIYINFHQQKPKEAMTLINSYWRNNVPDWPLAASFLSQNLEQSFRKDKVNSNQILFLSIFAVLISSLGLLGLIFFHIENKSKEFGIRLILGASKWSLSRSILNEMMIICFISWVISIPMSYYFVEHWLSNFHYHIQISLWNFIWAGLFIFILSIACVLIQIHLFSKEKAIQLIKEE